MGSSGSVIVTNLLMDEAEKKDIDKFDHEVRVWKGCVYDTFVVMKKSLGVLTALHMWGHVIDHELLIEELAVYGIEIWFSAYLRGQIQSLSLTDGSGGRGLSRPL